VSAASGGVGHAFESFLKILFGLGAARHLHQGHAKFVRGHGCPLSINIAFEEGSYQLSALSGQPSTNKTMDH
jgi:hypothetical protein